MQQTVMDLVVKPAYLSTMQPTYTMNVCVADDLRTTGRFGAFANAGVRGQDDCRLVKFEGDSTIPLRQTC